MCLRSPTEDGNYFLPAKSELIIVLKSSGLIWLLKIAVRTMRIRVAQNPSYLVAISLQCDYTTSYPLKMPMYP